MENLNNKFTGIFISAESLADNNTTLQEKMVLAMVSGLDNSENGCTAKNDYFANILHMTTRRVREIITSLEKKGYIKREDARTGRKLFVVKSKVVSTPVKQEPSAQDPVKEQPKKVAPATPKKVATPKKTKFNNIYSHDRNFNDLEQLEMARVQAEIGEISSDEFNQIAKVCGFGVTVEPSECVGGQDQFKIDMPVINAPAGIDEKTMNLLNAGYSMEEIELFRSRLN